MTPLADAADLVAQVGRNWYPVIHDDPRWEGRGLIVAVARALRAVGLGGRLRWAAVPGQIEAGSLERPDYPAGTWPRGIEGKPWAIAVVPGSVVVLAERDPGEVDPLRVAIGARLRPTQPGRVIVEVESALTPARRVTVRQGQTDRALERLIIAQESIAEAPAAANVPAPPREVVRIGQAIGVAWDLPGLAAPFVIWTLRAWAEPRTAGGDPLLDPADPIAILVEAARQLGATGHVRSRRAGDPPPLDYGALLDPGEHVTATAIITS